MQTILQFLKSLKEKPERSGHSPLLFVGHGNPMNAIEDNHFRRTWEKIGKEIPQPEAILVISAHWQTRGSWVTAMENPRTIHDFYGFPQELYEQKYPSPGNPELASMISGMMPDKKIGLNSDWGLDHGTWSVLKPMFPKADIPVVQLSLDAEQPPEYHFMLAKNLEYLRKSGVMIIGSGNIVHNLSLMKFSPEAYDWAIEFDDKVKSLIDLRDYQPLIDYDKLGEAARLSIPTNEHYLPLLYSLALVGKKDEIQYFNEVATMGSVSMRSFIAG